MVVKVKYTEVVDLLGGDRALDAFPFVFRLYYSAGLCFRFGGESREVM
jgi:hypothetical protein